jgi:hypothetical protein
MNPRDFLKEFDKDFQIDSVPESDQLTPHQKTSQKYQTTSPFAGDNFDFAANMSFSGLNDSSQFDAPRSLQQQGLVSQSPLTPKIKPSLDDIPNYEQYLSPRSPHDVPNPIEEDSQMQQSSDISKNANQNLQFSPKAATRAEPKQFSVPSFSFSSVVPSTPNSHASTPESGIPSSPVSPQEPQLKPGTQSGIATSSATSTETQNMLNTIQELRKERAKDAEKLKDLMTENARLQAKLALLEHTDVKVAELGSKVEQLLQDYLENEQVRSQQASIVTQLRQEVIVLKSRMQASNMQSDMQPQKPRVRFD